MLLLAHARIGGFSGKFKELIEAVFYGEIVIAFYYWEDQMRYFDFSTYPT